MKWSYWIAFASASSIAAGVVISCVGDQSGPNIIVNGDGAAPGDDSSTTNGTDGSSMVGNDSGGATSEGGADATAPKPAWTLALTGTTGFAQAIVETATGNIYVSGNVSGDVPELGITAAHGPKLDALLMKIEGATGKILWATSWGGSEDDVLGSLVLGGGNLFALGTTSSASIDFPNASPGATVNLPSTTNALNRQTFVVGVDPQSGKAKWAYSPDAPEDAGSNHASLCTSLAYTNEVFVGCNFIGGHFNGNLTSSSGVAFNGAVLEISNVGFSLGYVRRYVPSSGSVLLSRLASAGTSLYGAYTTSNVLDEVNDAGSTVIAQGFGPSNGGVLDFNPASTGTTAVVWKGDSTVNTRVTPSAVALTSTHAYAFGVFTGSPIWDAGAASPTFDGGPGPQYDLFVADLPIALGGTNSVVRLGGTGDEYANAIAVDGTSSPSIWIGGAYESADFMIAGFTLPAPATAGTQQAFFARLGLNGTPMAATAIVSPTASTLVNALAPDNASGYIVVAGTYGGTVTFDDKTKATSTGASAGFLLRRKM